MRSHRVVAAAFAAVLLCSPAAAHHRHAHHRPVHHRQVKHKPLNFLQHAWHWLMSIQNDIVTYARQHGIDPAYALAVAERESSFRPNAHASKTIYGLFQMSGAERAKYGVPVTQDVGTQVRGFSDYTNNLKADMAKRLGREPTPSETYLGHYWGPGRAAGVIKGRYSGLTAKDVFTPYELSINPNLKPNKPIEDLADGIIKDMDRRYSKYGGQAGETSAAPVDDPSVYLRPTADTAGDTTAPAGPKADDPSVYLRPTETAAAADQPAPVPAESGAPAQKNAMLAPPSAPETAPKAPKPNLSPATPNLSSTTADLSPAPSTDDSAMTTAALNDTGGGKSFDDDLSGLLSGIGNAMSKPKQPAAPKPNSEMDFLQQLALAQQAQTPVQGMPSLPGSQQQGSPGLPTSSQQAPSYLDPRMFGGPPTQQG